MPELITKTSKEIAEYIAKQKQLCEERGLLHFAPGDGGCWSCHKNIYQNYSSGN